MKKLLIACLLLVGLASFVKVDNIFNANAFNVEDQTPRQLLTAPVDYDYEYGRHPTTGAWGSHNAINNLWTYPTFLRTSDGAFYNYSTTIGSTNLFPFSVEMTYYRSNSGWSLVSGNYYQPAYGSGYMGANDEVGINDKIKLLFFNTTDNDYRIYLDCSNNTIVYTNAKLDINLNNYTYVISNSYMNILLVPAHNTLTLTFGESTEETYLTRLYMENVGLNQGYSNGINQGSSEGYLDGFGDGVSVGQGQGYSSGFAIGESQGYESGYSDGLANNSGYEVGYQDGSNDSFQANIHVWIVPAIILVLIGGGFFAIWSKKRQER